MKSWLRAVWFPAVIVLAGPLALSWVLPGTWPLWGAGCAFWAGWRVVLLSAGAPSSAAFGGLAVLFAALAPGAIVASVIAPDHELAVSFASPQVLVGIIPLGLVLAVVVVAAMLLGWLGGKAAMHWGRAHAT